MFSKHLRDAARMVGPAPNVHEQGLPPNSDLDAVLVKFVDQAPQRITRKLFWIRIPVARIVEPAGVQRCGFYAEFLDLRDGPEYLLSRKTAQVSPAAPVCVKGRARRLGQLPTLVLEDSRPNAQRLVIIA